jgi:septal ring factor EnvC (AmiA/AmiB activator)
VKRLIVIMISVIFLSAFIMMNYLLWDKDNLVKQQEQDKIQQDWLLGQNRALEQSIQDQDSINKKLTTEISELKFQITQFESQLRSSKDQNDLTSQLLTEKNQVVEVYKSDSLDKLRGITENWLLAINEGRLDDSFLLFGTQAVFMGRLLNLESYKEYFTTCWKYHPRTS